VLLGIRQSGGRSFMTCLELLQILIMLLANIAVQVIFSWWALNASTDPFGDSVQSGVLFQRLDGGHHFNKFDNAALSTLANRTCTGSILSALSTTSADIADYVALESFTNASSGIVITCLAIFIWVLEMTKELRCTFSLTCACICTRLPEGKRRTTSTITSNCDDTYEIEELSTLQKVGVVLLMALPRMTIASLLLIAGIKFLAYTESVSDIIVNSCALNVIKDVDEIVFDSITPGCLKNKVQNTLVRAHAAASKRLKTPDQLSFLVRLAFVLGMCLYGYSGFQKNMGPHVATVDTNACGQDVQWTWINHPMSAMPMFVSTDTDTVKGDRLNELTCVYQAKYDMLQVRGGFLSSEFEDKISGSAATCKFMNSTGSCAGLSMSTFRLLTSTASSDILKSPSFCLDQDIAYTFLRRGCMANTAVPLQLRNLLKQNLNCSGFAGLTACPNSTTSLQ